ncbi:FAST kinase domain-containing protein 4 [Protopterus annectens]|uniref:FAST kinase domain-containing protein 4 n=1 Tax=Protopterus annectens TaxID=7888 RepID=UPI001CFADE1E|nr:FAST kinase domain-containing protein 4 [Protopterus annectens]
MASRVVRRAVRLIGASFVVAPVSSAVPGSAVNWRGLKQGYSLSPIARLHVSSFHHGDRILAEEQVISRVPERTELDGLIESADSVENLLHLINDHSFKGNQAAVLVNHLSRIAADRKMEGGSILQDNRFQKLQSTLEDEISTVWNGNLVSLLRSLYYLGQNDRNKTLRLVENEVHWRLRRLGFKHLATLAEFYVTCVRTAGQKALMDDIIKNLELRWTEIEDAKLVATLMLKVGHLSTTLMDRLEDKGLELAEHFTPEDTRKMALALAQQNRRSIPLLRALSYHLMQKHFDFRSSLLVDLAFAYGKLNFHQTQVFQKLAAELLSRVPELSPGDVMRCTKSFSYLKWLNLPLFEAFTQHVMDNLEKYNPLHLCNIIMAFARLNYHPAKVDSFFGVVLEKLECVLADFDRFLLIDLVWSLCILQQVKTSHLQKVLEPVMYSAFVGKYSEVLLDSDNKPLPLNEFVAPHVLHSEGIKPLPQGARRLAFLCWEFPSYCSRSKDLLGRFVMARRHLQAAGFLIVDVPYFEWLELKSEWQKVAYLKDKMGKVVAEDMAR